MGGIEYFIYLLSQIRVMLDSRFLIPALNCSYWDFVMGLAISSIVITVLVSTVRIGAVTYSSSSHRVRQRASKGER